MPQTNSCVGVFSRAGLLDMFETPGTLCYLTLHSKVILAFFDLLRDVIDPVILSIKYDA